MEEWGASTEDVIPLSDLSVKDFLHEGVVANVCFGVESCVVETICNLLSVWIVGMCNGDHDDLSRRDPEGPTQR